jgi:hypothetical protein
MLRILWLCRIHHTYMPMLFGIYYTTFSVIYWAAGGTGRCAERCFPLNHATAATTGMEVCRKEQLEKKSSTGLRSDIS